MCADEISENDSRGGRVYTRRPDFLSGCDSIAACVNTDLLFTIKTERRALSQRVFGKYTIYERELSVACLSIWAPLQARSLSLSGAPAGPYIGLGRAYVRKIFRTLAQ